MMRDEDRRKIKELLGTLKCPKGFDCAASGFRYLCEAEKNETGCHLKCLEHDPTKCVFASPNDDGFNCGCPLRQYIADKLKL